MMDTVMMEDHQLGVQTIDKNSKTLREHIIDHVVLKASDSDFKNQQKDQSEFSLEERRKITEDILNNSHSKFLYIFGEYLIEDHLEYFKSGNYDNYEIHFHLHRLSRLINSKKVICKNRRYQAMLELLKGDYFSDNEMRNREPLLWEQLVGQYLTEEEKFNYDNQYLPQNSLTEVLLEQIDRDNRDDLKRKQQMEEIHEVEEEDDNNDSNDNSNKPSTAMEVHTPSAFWGEYSKPKIETVKIGKRRWKEDHFLNLEQCNNKELNENERLLLLNEFKSHMIHKFLSGEEDYDYNNVDNNPEYDNLHIKSIDEEDKYFDSESPIEGTPVIQDDSDTEHPIESDDEEDGLDTYMNMLKKNEITDSVTNKLKNL
ncbi:coiled-coil domain-containing protein 97 [Acyrthosiphon pisum]|uniref:CCD97-like C-terminal domain-containing protein n=1 Tax=Acyrthosiphon pisum TaxID=7029 RepID=A0A8R2A2C1_ACYPI|nr:coiled-coil domain-containing protein 97 [Acyrthosiphon pisum]|eukprot:XP_001944408.4 PREDICTED: coiled-coil domain-containing protein 97 [Acyrthosiphon pisum]